MTETPLTQTANNQQPHVVHSSESARPIYTSAPPSELPTKTPEPVVDNPKINIKRYRKVNRFFLSLILHVVWWDIILNRPILRYFRTPPLPRWQKLARRFRGLAIEMGGVLIKLGQFLSVRVDILPEEVTTELAGLQDEVPAEPFDAVIARIEGDFKRPVSEIFAKIFPEALGAASLAQAHRAQLLTGETVVVKVLRPNIETTVETDLLATNRAIRIIKLYKPIREFVDLEWLKEEFITVTRNELDFAAEGKNTERFIQDFAHDPQISAPQILWDYTAPHVITLEDVSYFRIDDFAALDAAGINRTEVSKKLFNNYLEQFFITNMVHADPHAGNLFVKPLPTEEETAAGRAHFLPDEPVPHVKDRPFQIVFIDFGMTVIVPERLRAGLKDYVIGVGTRDAARVVRSYVDTGSLLPNADLDAIEQMTEDQFTQFWGAMMGQMQGVDLDSYNRFFNRDYREVIYSNKFQFQMDMLFVMRAMGILSGMATKLDPGFNPMNHIVPFAQQMAQQDITQNWEAWLKQAVDFTQIFFKVPIDLRETLSKVHQGKFVIQTKLTPTTQKSLNQINTSLNRLLWAIVMIGLLLVAAVWYVGNLIATALQQLG